MKLIKLTIQYNTIQYNTIQYNTIQYNTIHLLKTLLTEKKFQHTVVWNKLYKRELIKKIEFPKGKNFEDNLYNFKSFELCNKYVYSNKVIYNYLLRKDSITKQKLNIKDFDKIWISNTIKEECKKYNDVELDIYAQKRLVYCYVMIFLKWMNNNSIFSYAEIRPYIKNYKKEKKGYIRYFKNFFRIVSFLICIDIRFAKIFYKMYNILKK